MLPLPPGPPAARKDLRRKTEQPALNRQLSDLQSSGERSQMKMEIGIGYGEAKKKKQVQFILHLTRLADALALFIIQSTVVFLSARHQQSSSFRRFPAQTELRT